MEELSNLDAVKIEYRKVTARSINLGWTSASSVEGETINFKDLEESLDGVIRAIWDVSNLPDYAYEVRLKSECMRSNELLPLKLRQFYSDPIVGLIDKTSPQVFGEPQRTVNLSP